MHRAAGRRCARPQVAPRAPGAATQRPQMQRPGGGRSCGPSVCMLTPSLHPSAATSPPANKPAQADSSKYGTVVSQDASFAEAASQKLASGGAAARVKSGWMVKFGFKSPFRLSQEARSGAEGLVMHAEAGEGCMDATPAQRACRHARASMFPPGRLPVQDWVLFLSPAQREGADAAALAAVEAAAQATGLPLTGALHFLLVWFVRLGAGAPAADAAALLIAVEW